MGLARGWDTLEVDAAEGLGLGLRDVCTATGLKDEGAGLEGAKLALSDAAGPAALVADDAAVAVSEGLDVARSVGLGIAPPAVLHGCMHGYQGETGTEGMHEPATKVK